MKRKRKLLAAALCLTMVFGFAPTAMASSTGHLFVNVKQNYTVAKQMLKKINAKRTSRGLRSLKLDSTLTKCAVTRAAEVAIYVPTTSPHKRPNGKYADSINSRISYECAGESSWIDATSMLNSWMGSSAHRAGILRSSARSVGIACVTVDNMGEQQQVWILDFSDTSRRAKVSATGIKGFTKKVEVLNSKVTANRLSLWDTSMGCKTSTTIEVGEAVKLSGTCRNFYLKWNVPLRTKSFYWKSSNRSVATFNLNTGKVVAHKCGTTTITAKLKDGTKRSVKIKIKVVDPS